MDYRPANDAVRAEMLDAVGAQKISDLFVDIPAQALLKAPVAIDEGLSEIELVAKLKDLSDRNTPATELISFLGAGIYDHYIPALIDHIILKPEFFTAYTPYQPEVSQGTLQAMYEYQSSICELTGMDVSNASMYDGATAMVEAGLMAKRISRKRSKLLIAGSLHPEYLETLETYAEPGIVEIEIVKAVDGLVSLNAIKEKLNDDIAAIIIGYPNFYGNIEDVTGMIAAAKDAGALVVMVANPVMLSVLESPEKLGADIVVGEAQSLGNAMNFGGPGLGFFACKEKYMRQMPGRIVGKTVDVDGHDGYVLTLSTREQHIRREKATSNICSNHALNALIAGAYLASVGAKGLAQVAKNSLSNTHYLKSELCKIDKIKALNEAPFAYEFAVKVGFNAYDFVDYMLDWGYLAGLALDENTLLLSATEKRTLDEIDNFVSEVKSYVN